MNIRMSLQCHIALYYWQMELGFMELLGLRQASRRAAILVISIAGGQACEFAYLVAHNLPMRSPGEF